MDKIVLLAASAVHYSQ